MLQDQLRSQSGPKKTEKPSRFDWLKVFHLSQALPGPQGDASPKGNVADTEVAAGFVGVA
jgi:hypothetical protein